jgi:hypothetical protein
MYVKETIVVPDNPVKSSKQRVRRVRQPRPDELKRASSICLLRARREQNCADT